MSNASPKKVSWWLNDATASGESVQLETFGVLDVTVRRTFERRWGSYVPYLQVLNVYNRRNPWFYQYDFDQNPVNRETVRMLPILPTQFGLPGYVAPLVVITAGYALFQAANNTSVMAVPSSAERGVVRWRISSYSWW